jgi:hypothetical protein
MYKQIASHREVLRDVNGRRPPKMPMSSEKHPFVAKADHVVVRASYAQKKALVAIYNAKENYRNQRYEEVRKREAAESKVVEKDVVISEKDVVISEKERELEEERCAKAALKAENDALIAKLKAAGLM